MLEKPARPQFYLDFVNYNVASAEAAQLDNLDKWQMTAFYAEPVLCVLKMVIGSAPPGSPGLLLGTLVLISNLVTEAGLSSSLLKIICYQNWYQRKYDYMDRAYVNLLVHFINSMSTIKVPSKSKLPPLSKIDTTLVNRVLKMVFCCYCLVFISKAMHFPLLFCLHKQDWKST